MNYFLAGGPVSVGKSETVFRIARYLLGKGFRDVHNLVPATQVDFCALLEGSNTLGKTVRIIINSIADADKDIDCLSDFYADNPCDIIISAIRCDGYPVRTYFMSKMNVTPADSVTEMPMAKISGNLAAYQMALNWYRNSVDAIIQLLLGQLPFFL
jgi:hypothetical protein